MMTKREIIHTVLHAPHLDGDNLLTEDLMTARRGSSRVLRAVRVASRVDSYDVRKRPEDLQLAQERH